MSPFSLLAKTNSLSSRRYRGIQFNSMVVHCALHLLSKLTLSLSLSLGLASRASEDLGTGLSTTAASLLVAHEANEGQTDSTAAFSRKGPIRWWQCCSVTALPPAPGN